MQHALIREGLAFDKRVPKVFYESDPAHFMSTFSQFTQPHHISNVVLFHDGRPKKLSLTQPTPATQHFYNLLKTQWTVHEINLAQACGVTCDDIHASQFFLKKTQELIAPHVSLKTVFVALGSGTITDLLKHALFLAQKPDVLFVSVPTALTVTAFTSAFAVIDCDGAKRTHPSQNISATFWIESLLQAAPKHLNRAGFGDLLARFVAQGDWFLAHQLGCTKNYTEVAFRLLEPFTENLKRCAGAFQEPVLTTHALETLSVTLSLAGVAMTVSGGTTPLSGYEHVISHALDFLHISNHEPLPLHGEQVALATLTSSLSFDWLLQEANVTNKHIPEIRSGEKIIKNMLRGLPASAAHDIFVNDYQMKLEHYKIVREKWSSFQVHWTDVQAHLQTLTIRAHEIEALLMQAGLPTFPEELNPALSMAQYRWAARFSPFTRPRFCLADLIFWLGEDPCFVAGL